MFSPVVGMCRPGPENRVQWLILPDAAAAVKSAARLPAAALFHVDFLATICYISSMLELNSSFIWIFFLVWLLYIILDRLFFRPVGGVIAQREAKIAGDSARQESMMEEIEEHARVVEERLSQARLEAQHSREEWLKNGEEIRSRSVAAAREQAARLMDEKIAQLEGEIAAAESSLLRQVSMFSDKIKQAYL
jgi:F-type H+-transporting ATPase subunit b